MKHVYLDYNATTPLHPAALEGMLSFLKVAYGNPSSIHWAGRRAKAAIIDARDQVAELLHADPQEIIFTSSGSESINLAIKGAFWSRPEKKHFITTSVEHPAVKESLDWVRSQGGNVTTLPVNKDGILDLDQLRSSICPETNLISVMMANNETGILFPIMKIAEIALENGVLIHTDAVQTAGKIPIDLQTLPFDLLSFSAHKFYGPKGIGGLFIRSGLKLHPLIHGGGQERKRRAGTESVADIVGLGIVAGIAKKRMQKNFEKIRSLRNKVESALSSISRIEIVGLASKRMMNTTNAIFNGVSAETLLLNLDLQGIALSSGAACSSGKLDPSPVLLAMGYSEEEARSSIRISYGSPTTEEEVDHFLQVLLEVCGTEYTVPGTVVNVHNDVRPFVPGTKGQGTAHG